ncbi:MAG: peptide-methionine (S)-S-oxide reductase [Chitinophagales bacterium]
MFFGSQDPTTLNRQGPDSGTQYRSIAFYQNEKEKQIIDSYIKELTEKKVFNHPIVTEVKAFTKFYQEEDYHQNYEKLHPNESYVQSVSIPRLNRFKAKFPELLK